MAKDPRAQGGPETSSDYAPQGPKEGLGTPLNKAFTTYKCFHSSRAWEQPNLREWAELISPFSQQKK